MADTPNRHFSKVLTVSIAKTEAWPMKKVLELHANMVYIPVTLSWNFISKDQMIDLLHYKFHDAKKNKKTTPSTFYLSAGGLWCLNYGLDL